MKILSIDTSSNVATVAILDDNKLIGEYIINNKKTHSVKIMPMIKELMDSLEIDIKDVDLYAASIGPGSFTGLRIGIATIKSLAHVCKKQVVGVPTIDAMAYNLAYTNGLIVPIMDARRERVYTGIYKWDNSDFEVIKENDVLEIDELLNILKEKNETIIFTGDATEIYNKKIVEVLNEKALFTPSHLSMPRASSVGALAMLKAKNNELQSCFEMVPDYLRKSQAEREYEKKINSGENNE